MKKIIDIYKEYRIMDNLAMHQLRVAAVATEICENFNLEIEEVEKENIISACLLHDMGNIIKFNLNKFPDYNKPEGLEYWENVKKEYTDKYGEDEHIATGKIAKELGLSQRVVDLIMSVDSNEIERIKSSDDLGKKICIYADGRVTPHGIVSFEQRMIEAKERYKDHHHAFDDKKHNDLISNLEEIEKQIFSYTNIKPEEIDDKSIVKYLEKLKNFEI